MADSFPLITLLAERMRNEGNIDGKDLPRTR